MPTLPAPVAGRAERIFGHPVRVETRREVSPGLLLLRLAGEVVTRKSVRPGGEAEFRVSDRDFRHFTVADTDAARGLLDVLFVTARPAGPALDWLRGLAVGTDVLLLGPGHPLRPRGPAVVLGDVTAAGLAHALIAVARAGGPAARGAIEAPAADVPALTALLPGIDVVVRDPEPGRALHGWLDTAGPDLGPAADIHLAGHVPTITTLRRRLSAAGVDRHRIRPHAYWAPGRRGL